MEPTPMRKHYKKREEKNKRKRSDNKTVFNKMFFSIFNRQFYLLNQQRNSRLLKK